MACIFFPPLQTCRRNFWHSSAGVKGQSAKGRNMNVAVNHWEPQERFFSTASNFCIELLTSLSEVLKSTNASQRVGWESNWMIFMQGVAEIRRESKNRQPLHFWTWDPIHNFAGSDYHWGRWSIDTGFIQSSTMLRNVTQKTILSSFVFDAEGWSWNSVIFLVDLAVFISGQMCKSQQSIFFSYMCAIFKCSVTVLTIYYNCFLK